MQKGFTVIELLIVVAIAGILVAIISVAMNGFTTGKPSISTEITPPVVTHTLIVKLIDKKEWSQNMFVDPYSPSNMPLPWGAIVQRLYVSQAKGNVDNPTNDSELEAIDHIMVLLNCDSDTKEENSETLQANLKVGRWYKIMVQGIKYHGLEGRLPNVYSAELIPSVNN